MKIFKWTLHCDSFYLLMQRGAEILSVQEQNGQIVIWAKCDTTAECVNRRIVPYPTGSELPDKVGTFLGTVQLEQGNLVFHIFDYGECT